LRAQLGGGRPGGGAGHTGLDATSVRIGPSGPDDPNYPDGQVFYIDHNVATFTGHGEPVQVTDDPDFLGDTGIPVEPGHYSFRPAPGVAFVVQLAYGPGLAFPPNRTRYSTPTGRRAAELRLLEGVLGEVGAFGFR
jgi:hypothetical protein